MKLARTSASTLVALLGASTIPSVSSFLPHPRSHPILAKATTSSRDRRCVLSSAPSTTQSPVDEGSAIEETEAVTTTQPPASPQGSTTHPTMPSHSPATSLPNRLYKWRGHDIRYQVSGPEDADRAILLVHGLFVNSDHWRKTLTGLHDHAGQPEGMSCRVYALDLLGSGWSSKPSRDDPVARSANGENGRFLGCDSVCYRERDGTSSSTMRKKLRSAPVLENVPLGTPAGGNRLASSLDLRHPLGSPYNFYTWAEQIADFTRDVIGEELGSGREDVGPRKVTLVANSIGTMSSLQSVIDEPDLFDGCLVINPNFRELHMAEVPLSPLTMPLVRQVQSLLRENGHGLFRSLATPETVAQILREPYSAVEAIDDELISVLLDPLLTPGADDVVFDTLSYSAGPLPEQQLASASFPANFPVWVTYGVDDPWTPSKRVESLGRVCGMPSGVHVEGPVERVVGIEGAGHCPHDERPEKVNQLIWEFLERLSS